MLLNTQVLVSMSTNLTALLRLLLSGIQHTFSAQPDTSDKNGLAEGKGLSYSFFLADLLASSDGEPSCGPLSPEHSMSSDGCAFSVAICRM